MLRTNAFSFIEIMFEILIGKINIKISIVCVFCFRFRFRFKFKIRVFKIISKMEMLKSKKSQLTCSHCSKIYKDPIDLPCGDCICLEHLSDKDVLKAKRIKCKKCNKEFGVKNNAFKSNNELNQLLESQSYFSEEEIVLKQVLEESIQKFFGKMKFWKFF